MSIARDPPLLSAHEAAAELEVSRATLYAYVSRGLIRSEARPGSRSRLYRAEDVRALRARKAPGASERGGGLDWSGPVLDSAITRIADGRLAYRGRDAVRLADAASLESVAGLLWQAGDHDPFAEAGPDLPDLPALPPGIERAVVALALAAAGDGRAFALSGRAVRRTGARIVRLVAHAFAPAAPPAGPLHGRLAAAWQATPAAAEAIRRALVLTADHELNASTFTVRCVAGTGATPYGAVIAGLAALQGPRHGGQAAQVEALLQEADRGGDAGAVVLDRLRRGDGLPGFGHPLYPEGDPRAAALLAGLAGLPEARLPLALARAAAELADAAANVDFALATLARAHRLPAGAPLALFAVGRTVGWIAHAIEQYTDGRLIRPRARYVGEPPGRGD